MEKTLRGINGVYYTVYMITILSAVVVFMFTYLNVNIQYVDEKSPLGITISSLLVIYMLVSIPLAFWWFYKNTKKWQQLTDKFDKFRLYKQASVIRLWVIGAGLILGVIMTYLMRSTNMIYIAAIAAVALFFCKPTVGKMIKELGLDEEEEN
ncbi:MAG: hypothetical protein QM751_04635 [Paludibacteraceae bacterium]